MATDEGSFSAPRGTRDLIPPESQAWAAVSRHGMELFARAGFAPVETPMFEHTEVFERGVGAATEVVGKQMYTFEDRGGRSLTLRPELTAPVMRAVLEHRLDRGALPVKLSYYGPMFRQERPQKGRYRQFWQLGIESIGLATPVVDAEVIEIAVRFFRDIGLDATLRLNSVGHPGPECRVGYVGKLRTYLEERIDSLDAEDRERVDLNPLRTFDSKLPKTRAVMAEAPLLSDHLCDACRDHHDSARRLLSQVEIEFVEDPALVRGLDYYTRTAFEFTAPGLGAQDSVGGGGRYDGLSEALGGDPVPGIGFALGMDRIMLALEDAMHPSAMDAYVVAVGESAVALAFPLATQLRQAGLAVDFDLAGRGMKGQMKDASRSGARYAVILGEEEMGSGRATVKDMTTGEQDDVPLDALEERLQG